MHWCHVEPSSKEAPLGTAIVSPCCSSLKEAAEKVLGAVRQKLKFFSRCAKANGLPGCGSGTQLREEGCSDCAHE